MIRDYLASEEMIFKVYLLNITCSRIYIDPHCRIPIIDRYLPSSVWPGFKYELEVGRIKLFVRDDNLYYLWVYEVIC